MTDHDSTPTDVIVVGAGIAGLTAAYALQQRGLRVLVLEREASAGGRMRSERHGDFVVDRGAQFVASSYRNMRVLVDELGLRGNMRRLATGRGATLRNGKLVSGNYAGPAPSSPRATSPGPASCDCRASCSSSDATAPSSTSITSNAPPRSTTSPPTTGRSAPSVARCSMT